MFIKPDYNLKSIYDIDLEKLQQEGVKAMLFDLDSTLMASKSAEYSPKMLDWLQTVREKFFVAVVSNNKNEEYIAKVKQISDFPLLFNACKPKTCYVEKFLEEQGINVTDCVLVGDRPLTDVLCGKYLGCKTILVDSLQIPSQNW